MGITIPLFIVVQRCRDPSIRRRAISIMRNSARQEGAWESSGAADIIERWMLTEEAGLPQVRMAADIPEWKRLCQVDSAVDTERGVAQVVFSIAGTSDDMSAGPPVQVKEKIAFDSLQIAQHQQQRRQDTGGLRPFSMSLDIVVDHRVALNDQFELYGESYSTSFSSSFPTIPSVLRSFNAFRAVRCDCLTHSDG
jgi:hypothetical protein